MGLLMPLRSIAGGLPPLAMASRRGILLIFVAKGVNSLFTPGLFSCACWRLLVAELVLRVMVLLPVSVRVLPGSDVPKLETVSRVPGMLLMERGGGLPVPGGQ